MAKAPARTDDPGVPDPMILERSFGDRSWWRKNSP